MEAGAGGYLPVFSVTFATLVGGITEVPERTLPYQSAMDCRGLSSLLPALPAFYDERCNARPELGRMAASPFPGRIGGQGLMEKDAERVAARCILAWEKR
jgi:hypothetical protein